jgi:hypothetical protein
MIIGMNMMIILEENEEIKKHEIEVKQEEKKKMLIE